MCPQSAAGGGAIRGHDDHELVARRDLWRRRSAGDGAVVVGGAAALINAEAAPQREPRGLGDGAAAGMGDQDRHPIPAHRVGGEEVLCPTRGQPLQLGLGDGEQVTEVELGLSLFMGRGCAVDVQTNQRQGHHGRGGSKERQRRGEGEHACTSEPRPPVGPTFLAGRQSSQLGGPGWDNQSSEYEDVRHCQGRPAQQYGIGPLVPERAGFEHPAHHGDARRDQQVGHEHARGEDCQLPRRDPVAELAVAMEHHCNRGDEGQRRRDNPPDQDPRPCSLGECGDGLKTKDHGHNERARDRAQAGQYGS